MKILTAAQMRAADEATFSRIGVVSRAVMECAGRQCADLIERAYSQSLLDSVLVLAGAGNNGGDGFVAARAFLNLGIDVHVYALKPLSELKGDALLAARSYAAAGGVTIEYSAASTSEQESHFRAQRWGLLVDAILGTGITGEVTGPAAYGIRLLNSLSSEQQIPVIAIDLPSGVATDTGEICGTAVRCTDTVALQCLKPCHLLFPAAEYAGRIFLADIGIGSSLIEVMSVQRELLTASHAAALLSKSRALASDAHKGSRGHVLVLGGSRGKFGAPQLSAQAALRAGAGLATLALPKSAADEIAPSLKELMCEGLPEENGDFSAEAAQAFSRTVKGKDALVVGPGLDGAEGSVELLRTALQTALDSNLRIVVDAGALNVIADHPELIELLPGAVLTPHPGEMARLTGKSVPEVQRDRFRCAEEYAARSGAVVVLKGARTIIAAADGTVFLSPSATAVLGTAGSGDSLAGIIGALLAQGLDPLAAASAAVYVHGVSGEYLERTQQGVFGAVATDIADTVPKVLNAVAALSRHREPPSFIRQVVPEPWTEGFLAELAGR